MRDTRRRTLHPNYMLSLWHQREVHLWLLLGGCLLVLVISGCTIGSQAHVNQKDPGRADYIQASDAYCDRSQPANAIACYKQALARTYQQGSKGRLLLNLGWAYYELGQYATAVTYDEQALVIARQERNRTMEGVSLQNLGMAYRGLGQWTTAITYHEQALAIWRGLHNSAREIQVLNNLGTTYSHLSQYARAIAYFEQALSIARQEHNRAAERYPLRNLGWVYIRLSRYDQALAYLEQAVAVMREVHDWRGEVRSLNSLSRAYHGLGQYGRAMATLEQTVTMAREAGRRAEEGAALSNLGQVYHSLRQYDHATSSLEQALAIQREIGDRRGVGITLHALGRVYAALGQYDHARASYEQALVAVREVGDRDGEGRVFSALMAVWRAQHQPRLAIFYGKQATNRFQEIREHLQPLAEELQESFRTAKTPVYRELAEILLAEGRLLEAQQVLDLLKEEEYSDFVGRHATDDSRPGRVVLTPEEAAWAARYRAIADRLAALGTEYSALHHKPERTADETQRLGALEVDLAVARQAFEQFLAHLQVEVHQVPQGRERIARLAEESQGLMDALRDLGPGTVALYTLVTDTAYHVILTTPEVQLAREMSIGAADLARKVHGFRQALAPDTRGSVLRDPRPLGRELYQILVEPIAQDLRQAQATTLMWSLDGVLRYLPLAALHDGEQYLLERYRLTVFTPASATRLKDQPRSPWSGVGSGVSKAHGNFPALPTVPDELRGVIRDPTQRDANGVLPGLVHLDEAFTDATLRAALRQSYPVVHIASHFQLHPGDDKASFLLLGDGSHLPLAQLKTWPQPFQGVELLTLSACNTAVGSTGAEGKEVEGFAVLAQPQGAKAVVATLWPVVDVSTKELMHTFYRLREGQPGLPKVEALRQAQLALLRGPGPPEAAMRLESRAGTLVAEASGGPGGALPRFRPDPGAPYAHPAFWAPFVLVGNWR